ncbi:MAG: hypothetical protein HQM13_02825 [SAR324 cluster bacterium]|nr:hypothetical protein [SAR324 cluster bacterium]
MMARERWEIWRFCIVCNAKLKGTYEVLHYGFQDQSSDHPKEMHFYLNCDACGSVNPLDDSLIPGLVQEITKKEFYSHRIKEKRRKRN